MAEVVLVTGVGPGTGKSIVERFAGADYTVAMLARSEERLSQIKAATPKHTHLSAMWQTIRRSLKLCRRSRIAPALSHRCPQCSGC